MYDNTNGEKGKGYGKHSLTYWILLYIVVGAVVYSIIYLLFMRGSLGY